ncbi:MAG: hypothetical protein HKN23_07095 [Verrucomicrobiales bacterium]|nr:hypothetical protein [Verrucomicrobiales bacterium]
MVRLFPNSILWMAFFVLPVSGLLAQDLVSFPTTTNFLPRNWQRAPIDARISPLPGSLHEKSKTIVERALAKYPGSLIRRNLKGVRLVSSLEFYGIEYGGTYMPHSRIIILAYDSRFNDRGFEQRFHHEFSSVLLQSYENKFDDKRWKSANPPSFSYRSNGVIENGHSGQSEATKMLGEEQRKTGGDGSSLLELNSGLMTQGFLTRYNQVSIEQDVNETAAHLFTNPEIWTYCERHPRLDLKVDVLIDFYTQIDPALNRLHFRRITSR